MLITADIYMEAASEHVTASQDLYDAGRYVLGHYVAGLAVECILRAYRVRIDPEFDARHDLEVLYRLAKFAEIVPPRRVEAVGAAMAVVTVQWSNDLRFCSEDALRRRLVRLRLFGGIRGDFVKERTRRIVNAATEIVTVGVSRWNQ